MRYVALYPSTESVYLRYKQSHEIKANVMSGDNLRAKIGVPRNKLIYLYWMHVPTRVLSTCGQTPKIKKNVAILPLKE